MNEDSPSGDEALYVNRNLLQPGDILLTKGGAKTSTLISWTSGGPYSHAAIVVSSVVMFESDDDGVGYSPLNLSRVEVHGAERYHLVKLDGVENAEVRRPTALKGKDQDTTSKQLYSFLQPFNGLEYPSWVELSSAFDRGPIVNVLVRTVLELKDFWDTQKVWNPGPFCSQLVGLALAELECLQLKDPSSKANYLNPNSFLGAGFEPVGDAIRGIDPSAIVDDEYLKGVPLLRTRKEMTGELVKIKRRVSMIQEAANIWSNGMDKLMAYYKSLIDKRHRGSA